MKRNNKKGFTIVELVIVIAVIAILSAVLIPTFGGITEKANNSARDQEAKNAFTNYLVSVDAQPVNGKYIRVKDGNVSHYYKIENGQINLNTEVTTGVSAADVVWCTSHVDIATDDNHVCDDCTAIVECSADEGTCSVETCPNHTTQP